MITPEERNAKTRVEILAVGKKHPDTKFGEEFTKSKETKDRICAFLDKELDGKGYFVVYESPLANGSTISAANGGESDKVTPMFKFIWRCFNKMVKEIMSDGRA